MIYLDNAATSFPKPESVLERVDRILRKVGGNPGRSSHRMALEAGRVIFQARESLARLLNVPDASRIAFTKNATEALNIAIKGLSLRAGDHVVTTTMEHNSVARPLWRLEREGVKVTRVAASKDGFVNAKDIEKALTGDTRLITVVHASNVYGTIQPVGEIGLLARSRGIPFMVDAAQTVGALPVDVMDMNIDILAATGHKALFGPQGTGFLYVREGIEIEPLIDGGTGEMDTVLDMPDRMEAGTVNTPGIGGLGAGVEFVMERGLGRIREHEESLVSELLHGLCSIKGVDIIGPPDASKRVSLVSFNIAGLDPLEAGMRLDKEFSIMVRCGTHCAPIAHKSAGTYPHGTIRVSPGLFNTHDEIEEFLRAVSKMARG